MISFFEANLVKMALHHVGNPTMDQGYSISENEVDVTDEQKRLLLLKFFLSPFQKTNEIYRFYHPSGDLKLNESYLICKDVFEQREDLHEASVTLALNLYNVSQHPRIKSGELYVVLFENVQIEGELLPAIGIFKSETKETYLKVNAAIEQMDVSYERDGVSIDKLDKGYLIFNTQADAGYKVAVIDNSGKSDGSYWMDEFLQVMARKDAYQDTFTALSLAKTFITQKLDDEFEVSQADKIDLLNKSLKYFNEKEAFDIDEFCGEVFSNEQVSTSFKNHKSQYEVDFEQAPVDTFNISGSAVKKQARSFKHVLKLDKNFHIYIHGDKQLIERGFDESKSMNYYKVYFKHEAIKAMEDLFGNAPVEPGKLEVNKTQLEQIKNLFLAGKHLTVQSVLKLVHTQELRTYVPILRRDHGMQIESQWVHHGDKKFKVYFLKSA